jgi:hypothetical protein
MKWPVNLFYEALFNSRLITSLEDAEQTPAALQREVTSLQQQTPPTASGTAKPGVDPGPDVVAEASAPRASEAGGLNPCRPTGVGRSVCWRGRCRPVRQRWGALGSVGQVRDAWGVDDSDQVELDASWLQAVQRRVPRPSTTGTRLMTSSSSDRSGGPGAQSTPPSGPRPCRSGDPGLLDGELDAVGDEGVGRITCGHGIRDVVGQDESGTPGNGPLPLQASEMS